MKICRFIISDIERLETNKYLVYDIFLKKFFNINKDMPGILKTKNKDSYELYKFLLKKLNIADNEVLKEVVINKSNLNMVRVLVTNRCNLNCKYCYASSGTYGNKRKNMDLNIYSKVCEYLEKNYKLQE